MTGRTYGQICGLARAMEIVGERWSMLVVRDLLLGPKRFTDLRTTLHRIPASILSARLNELEHSGVVRRRVLPSLDAAVVYELTEYGTELEEVVFRLGLWGARSLGDPGDDDIFTMDTAIISLYTIFQQEAAYGVQANYEIHYGDMVVHALVDDGALKAEEGSYADADLIIYFQGPAKDLYTGDVSPVNAITSGLVKIDGEMELLEQFVALFHIPSAPIPSEGLAVR